MRRPYRMSSHQTPGKPAPRHDAAAPVPRPARKRDGCRRWCHRRSGSTAAEWDRCCAVTMGVRHPGGPGCAIPAPLTWDGPAMTRTGQAHAAALQAAVRHAAAAQALRVIEAETAATRHRLRAIENHWIPRLEQALTEVTLALEEQELADAARLRLAAGPNRRPDAT
jgi:ATP synthase subunit D